MNIDTHLTQEGAYQLARRIEHYWRDKGYLGIRAWVTERMGQGKHYGAFYDVRSNIGPMGYPPRRVMQDAAS